MYTSSTRMHNQIDMGSGKNGLSNGSNGQVLDEVDVNGKECQDLQDLGAETLSEAAASKKPLKSKNPAENRQLKWTTAQISSKNVQILQPDPRWISKECNSRSRKLIKSSLRTQLLFCLLVTNVILPSRYQR